MKIRAVTLFVEDTSRLPDLLDKVNAGISELSSKYGIRVLTKRVTLPFARGLDDAKARLRQIKATLARRGFVYSALSLMEPGDPVEAARLIEEYGTYTMMWMPDYDESMVKFYIEVLRNLKNPLNARYIAVLLGELIETPYYPASVNVKGGEGMSLALLYASDLIDSKNVGGTMRDVVKRGYLFGEELSEFVDVEFRGVDASLSPWGQESVAGVVEKVSGVRMGELGTIRAIDMLNRLIAEIPVGKIGFNEVMLPLGEDNTLKDRFIEGLMDLHKLISYTEVCVAGIDMVPIPVEQLELVRYMLLDLSSIAKVKGRPIGVRLIPARGAYVEFEEFGKTPVIDLRTGRVIAQGAKP